MAINVVYAGPIEDTLKRAAAASAYARASGGGGGGMSVASRGGGGGGGGGGYDTQARFDMQANQLDAEEARQQAAIDAQAERDAQLNMYQSRRDEVLHGYTGERLQQQSEIAQQHDERSYAQQTFQGLLREGAPLTFVETQSMNQLMNAHGAVMGRDDLSQADQGRVLREIDGRLNPLLQRSQAHQHRQMVDSTNMRVTAFANRRIDWPDVNSPPVIGEDGQPQRYPGDHPHFGAPPGSPEGTPGQVIRQRSIPMLINQHGMPERIPMNERPQITPEIWGNWHRNITASMPMPVREPGQGEAAYQAQVVAWRENVDRQVNEMRDSWHRMNQENIHPEMRTERVGTMEAIQDRLNPIVEEVMRSSQAYGMSIEDTSNAANDLRQLQAIARNPTPENLRRVPGLLAGLPPAVRDRLEQPRPASPGPRGASAAVAGGLQGAAPADPRQGWAHWIIDAPRSGGNWGGPQQAPPGGIEQGGGVWGQASPPQDFSRVTTFTNEINNSLNPYMGRGSPAGNFFVRLNEVADDATLPPLMRQDLAQIREAYRRNPRDWRSLRNLINTLPPAIRNRLGNLPIPEVMTPPLRQ